MIIEDDVEMAGIATCVLKEAIEEIFADQKEPRMKSAYLANRTTRRQPHWDQDVKEMRSLLYSLDEEVAGLAFEGVKTVKVLPRMAIGPEWDQARKELSAWIQCRKLYVSYIS